MVKGEFSPLLPRAPNEFVVQPSLRSAIWTVLRFRSTVAHTSGLQRISYLFELGILILILINVIVAVYASSVIAETRNEDTSPYTWYDIFLYGSTLIFSMEYGLRLWSCVEDERYRHPITGRLRWMFRPMSIIDFAALLPFYLEILLPNKFVHSNDIPCAALTRPHRVSCRIMPSSRGALTIRGLRLLRILVFLRLERSYNALRNLRMIFALKGEELLIVSYLTAVIVFISATIIFFLENEAQPQIFSSIGVCIWWTIETITSLGYGDLVPVTAAGRTFSSMLALWGIVLFTIPGAVLGSGFVEVMLKKQEEQKRQFEESLRSTLSQEIHSVASIPVSPTGEVSPNSSNVFHLSSQLHALQSQMEQLADAQLALQQQMKRQEEQMDRLLDQLRSSANPNYPHPLTPSKCPPSSGVAHTNYSA